MEDLVLTKDSIMPYGKHKGKKMNEVPLIYYKWMYNKNVKEQNTRKGPLSAVMVYILTNLDQINADYAINVKKNFSYKKYFKK